MRYHDLPGDNTPIVFIHGIGCASSFDYPEVATRLAHKGHRCILVDLLGAGFSDKPEAFAYSISAHAQYLADFIRSLQLGRCYLYGHSRGGSVAIELTGLITEQLAGLVLSEANLDAGGGMFSKQIAAISEQDYVHCGHQQVIARSVDSADPSGKLWAASMRLCLPQAVHREAVSLIAGGSPSWRQRFYALPVPKAFVFGVHSLPDPDTDILAAQGIDIALVEDAGHSMAWENPQGLAKVLGEVLEGWG